MGDRDSDSVQGLGHHHVNEADVAFFEAGFAVGEVTHPQATEALVVAE